VRLARALAPVAVALLVGGCGRSSPPGGASPEGEAPPAREGSSCPEVEATYVPAGFEVAERVQDGPGILVVYRDATGQRELSFLSGVPFDGHGSQPTGKVLTVRGHRVEVRRSEPDTLSVVWQERPVEEPCHLYAIIGVGLPEEEFLKVLAGVR
jgi:hypothetical protein